MFLLSGGRSKSKSTSTTKNGIWFSILRRSWSTSSNAYIKFWMSPLSCSSFPSGAAHSQRSLTDIHFQGKTNTCSACAYIPMNMHV
ncbi:hypothetical protein QJS04_geneDACA007803 [Acorus gramineus]|uniref:Uncharacterized protein n=1 Tax=Acorus gramineus TaxID=55184 RepID=A0AAV9B958_ACOGR|nr:hypothetical protein QJS04_geneDACA007803 [Acorus gramineus]